MDPFAISGTIVTITAALVAGIWHLRSHIDSALKENKDQARQDTARVIDELKTYVHATFANREDLVEMRGDMRAIRLLLEHVLHTSVQLDDPRRRHDDPR
jgi:hypothetical protein